MAEEFSLDLEELRHLQSIAKRPRVISLISSQICNLEKLSKETVSAPSLQTPTPIPISTSTAKVPINSAIVYTPLPGFSWDQDNDKLKIYISLEGIDQEKVEAVYKETSVDIKFHDVKGKNYRFAIHKLNEEIVPEKSKFLVRPTRAVITLFKASKGNWLDLQMKEDKLKPSLDKERNPMAGIMDLMKNMYDDGDDEMKKTIAKAWTDARSGKTADPLKGFP
ncbi:calcyclin-binding protein-like [Cucurbita moschata]|uniref:Calcyclin-binding protein n=1 Tax=Cucurbita moschata TaxID=3662 RepID=A0A6J1GUL5_CUCMO|nr:calcyclin-binding protein-like [Cucurbita moschata]